MSRHCRFTSVMTPEARLAPGAVWTDAKKKISLPPHRQLDPRTVQVVSSSVDFNITLVHFTNNV